MEQLLRAAYCFAFLDIRQRYLRHARWDLAAPWGSPTGQQILLGWMTAFQSGCGMAVGYYLGAAVAVATGLYKPRDWPPLMGSFGRKGYTMRNIWGCCWCVCLV